MNNVTIVWSVIASCSLLLAIMHAIVWLMDRKALANLALASFAASLVAVAIIELTMMHSTTAQEWATWARWILVPIFVLLVSIVLFFRFHLRTGRDWLLWVVLAMRAVILVVNFLVDPSFNFDHIGALEQTTFLGEQVSVAGHTVAASRQWFATLSMVLVLVYMGDALVTLWRTGTRAARRTVIVLATSTIVSTAFASLFTHLLVWGVVQVPVLLSPPFSLLLLAMAYEMSQDTLRASRLARELRESEARLEFAADSAGLGLWSWDAHVNKIWATNRVHEMFGLASGDSLGAERLKSLVHADDVARVQEVLQRAAVTGTVQEVRFRITLPDGATSWILGRGRTEADENGRLTSIQGVLRDVTEQFQTRRENDELRRDLAHVERVSVLGRLSSSLAHELSQPLAAILHNTEAAEILLKGANPDLAELRAIVADIQRDDLRAGEVIAGLRALFTRRELAFSQLSIESLVQGVISLLRTDALERQVSLEYAIEPGIPAIDGDRVHLSQVLINLLINGMDAVADASADGRRVIVSARIAQQGWVEFAVADSGPGFSDHVLQRIFEPFFTTKTGGMGMGLSVSRTIIEAHHGKLWAENGAAGGANVRVVLPIRRQELAAT